MFIGHDRDGVGYMFYDFVMKKFIRCFDAEFIEIISFFLIANLNRRLTIERY